MDEIYKLQLAKAEMDLILARPYWTRTELCKVANISLDTMRDIEKAGDGPDWLKIGGQQMVVDSTGRHWINNLPKTKWSQGIRLAGKPVCAR